MESNWRWNVANLGMVGAGWRLCSHRLTTNYPTYRVIVALDIGFGAEYQIAAPGQLPSLINVFVPPAAHPHFPYGRPVDPD